MADKHNIPKGKMHSTAVSYQTTQSHKDNIWRVNPCDLALKLLNKEIPSDIQKHNQNL